MAESAKVIEERILDTLEELEQSENPKIATVACNHVVLYHRVRAR